MTNNPAFRQHRDEFVSFSERCFSAAEAELRAFGFPSRSWGTRKAGRDVGRAVYYFFCTACLCASPSLGQEPPSGVVVARVNGQPILRSEVRRQLDRAIGGRAIDPAARPRLEAETLEQVINRRLVLDFLSRRPYGASQQDIDLEVSQIEKQLARQDVTLPQFLEKSAMQLDDLRRQVAWRLGWQSYLDQKVNDETLQKYFQQHQRDFDGTQIEVAHILWRLPANADQQARMDAQRAASQVREQIMAGQLTFAQAAQKHSAAPTAHQGGRIGKIGRHEPMPESFSDAAFQLEADQISPPVVSAFGVHLIRCLAVTPGEKTWRDARDQLEPAVTRYLFQWLSNRERASARIEYSDPAHAGQSEQP